MLVLGSNDMVPCTLLTLFPNRKSLFYILVFLLFDTAWHILSCVHKMSFIPPLCVYHALTLRPQQLNFSPHALDVLWFPAVVFPLDRRSFPVEPGFHLPTYTPRRRLATLEPLTTHCVLTCQTNFPVYFSLSSSFVPTLSGTMDHHQYQLWFVSYCSL